MMNTLSSSLGDSIGLGRLQLTPKPVQEERLIEDGHPSKKTLSITDLPDDCLSLVYQSLDDGTDYSSFGLVCRHWFHIQNNNHKSLWDTDNPNSRLRNICPERFSKILCKLLIRFQHLERLFLRDLPEVTDYITSQSQFFGSNIQFLCLDYLSEYSDMKLSMLFSSFPRLKSVCLRESNITDNGLQILANCCASLEKVDLRTCRITDSGISFLIKNCFKLHSLRISYCHMVTGIGFLGCPKTLTTLYALVLPKLTTEGIKAIVSGGGLQSLHLSGFAVDNNEAVNIISKGCPLLKELVLRLKSCHEVPLEGWKGMSNGCNKLSYLVVNSLSDIALEFFKRERSDVHLLESFFKLPNLAFR